MNFGPSGVPVRYRCLILDHDDTAVNSTPLLHYPAHRRVMEILRPGIEPASLEEWMRKNFSPGILSYLEDELGFSPEEVQQEYEIWQEFVQDKPAQFFPGFIPTLQEFHEQGGILAVISHSTKENVLKDYAAAGAEHLIQAVYGWEHEKEMRKPSPYPVNQILETFGLKRSEALILDDLKPAVIMAKASGVDIAAAGWGIQVPEIEEGMRSACTYYFETIRDMRDFLMDHSG